MAKVKIELDLDWLEEGESIDGVIKEEVLSNIQNRLVKNAEQRMNKRLDEIIEGMAEKVTDKFIHEKLESKINSLTIPYKESSWNSEVVQMPISEFVGMRYERYLNEKTLDERGNQASHRSDRKLSISEYFINNYLGKELTTKVSAMIATARKDAEETVVKALENNLKEQLSSDIIERLNVPKMLESLQEKAKNLDSK